jgi:hypothetical protein
MEKLMKKSGYYLSFLVVLAAFVISSVILISCPPINESHVDNNVTVTGDLTISKWSEILDSITAKGIFVNLDLRECTVPDEAFGEAVLKRVNEDGSDYTPDENVNGSYIQFNPAVINAGNGKGLIISIILPDAATMIASSNISPESFEDTEDLINDSEEIETNNYAFRHFTRLRSVTGKNISFIGTFAFFNCSALADVNLPKANTVMDYAFYNCAAFKKLELENLSRIMPSAFENCAALERVDFPLVNIISQKAFKGCTNLTEVNFIKAMLIEEEAFRNCSKLKRARFLIDPARTSSGHPLDPWRDNQLIPYRADSMAFHSNVFRGCTSLEMLDMRFIWNVYFGAGALSDIGKSLNLHLFDDDGTISYGHPQVELLLGKRPVSDDNKKDLDIGELTLKELKIFTSNVTLETDSQIMYTDNTAGADGYASIRNNINAVYNTGDRFINYNEPKNPAVKVTVNGKPTAEDLEL